MTLSTFYVPQLSSDKELAHLHTYSALTEAQPQVWKALSNNQSIYFSLKHFLHFSIHCISSTRKGVYSNQNQTLPEYQE